MSDTLVIDTEKDIKKPTFPKEIQDRMDRYPNSNDKDYWTKVPELFAEEFDSQDKVERFKTNWIVYKVPLYTPKVDKMEERYFIDNVRMISEKFTKEDWQQYFDLMTECEKGHFADSMSKLVKPVSFSFNEEEYNVDNVGGNCILKLNHILTYEALSNKNIKDYDVIVEFGAGIGEFARIVRQYGFQGEYYDIDFEPMCRIAEYNTSHEKNNFVRSVKDLPDLSGKKVLFVGTWSFSEINASLKKEVIKKMKGCDWLIASQASVFGQDCLNYFVSEFPKASGCDIKMQIIPWHDYQGGNFYVVGTFKAKA